MAECRELACDTGAGDFHVRCYKCRGLIAEKADADRRIEYEIEIESAVGCFQDAHNNDPDLDVDELIYEVAGGIGLLIYDSDIAWIASQNGFMSSDLRIEASDKVRDDVRAGLGL